MNQKNFIINPETKEIDLKANLYYVKDHIPNLDNFMGYTDIQFSIENPNSIKYYFNKHGVDYTKKQFIFDHYLNFEDFKYNGRFEPHLFRKDVKEFLGYEESNSINVRCPTDDLLKKKSIPLNCLMNKPRPHREIISCWLYNNIDSKNLLYTQSWDCKEESPTKDYVEFLDNKNSINIYNELPRRWIEFHKFTSNADNPEKFYQYFYPKIFSKTFFSLVLEPDFFINASSISEKYIYAIKGLTIPIITGYKIYEKLKLLGFHVFDDIVNTEYQYEVHPVKRIWKMLENNKELMSGNVERFKNKSVKERMFENYTHISNIDKLIHNFQKLNNNLKCQK